MKRLLFVLGFAITGCSGGSPDIDASADATTDATMDAGADVAMDGIADDAAMDSGGMDAGGSCGDAGTRAMCERCCVLANPQGFDVFATAALKCACASNLCGPVDGGAADGGVFGNGDCAMTCNNPKVMPDNKCVVCLRDSDGKMGMGPCGKEIDTACAKSADCVQYLACTKTCN